LKNSSIDRITTWTNISWAATCAIADIASYITGVIWGEGEIGTTGAAIAISRTGDTVWHAAEETEAIVDGITLLACSALIRLSTYQAEGRRAIDTLSNEVGFLAAACAIRTNFVVWTNCTVSIAEKAWWSSIVECCQVVIAASADSKGTARKTVCYPTEGAKAIVEGVVSETSTARVQVSIAGAAVIDQASTALTIDQAESRHAGGAEVDRSASSAIWYSTAGAFSSAGKEEPNLAVDALTLCIAVLAIGDNTSVATGGTSCVEGESCLAAVTSVRSTAATDAVVDVATETWGKICS